MGGGNPLLPSIESELNQRLRGLKLSEVKEKLSALREHREIKRKLKYSKRHQKLRRESTIHFPLSFEEPQYDLNSIDLYSNISQLLTKRRVISIEGNIGVGNIGVGKTSFIQKINPPTPILTLREPLNVWTNLKGINLLNNMYRNPREWAFTFQSYVLLTMMQNHLHPARTKIMERSASSANCVFSRVHHSLKNITSPQLEILNQWLNFCKFVAT